MTVTCDELEAAGSELARCLEEMIDSNRRLLARLESSERAMVPPPETEVVALLREWLEWSSGDRSRYPVSLGDRTYRLLEGRT